MWEFVFSSKCLGFSKSTTSVEDSSEVSNYNEGQVIAKLFSEEDSQSPVFPGATASFSLAFTALNFSMDFYFFFMFCFQVCATQSSTGLMGWVDADALQK